MSSDHTLDLDPEGSYPWGMAKRTGKNRSVLLRPEQDDALTRLIEETGINRNQIFRLVATRMTPLDVTELLTREPADRQR